jgi:hypothetical protein
VRHAAIAGVGRREDAIFPLRIVQRVIQPGDHSHGIAKRRMDRDVLDPLAVDEDLAAVAQRLDELVSGHRRGVLDVGGRLGILSGFYLAVADSGFHEPPTFDMRTTVRRANE